MDTAPEEVLPELKDEIGAPSIETALAAIQFWQTLDRIYAPVRNFGSQQQQVTFSVGSLPMLNLTPTR
ncbi:MAG TPA: hypothetical protein VNN25_22010 [Thermoanaerobaculia bacterium]|nr:hypothetical protein [Thermoanaerobaculia bacterium]